MEIELSTLRATNSELRAALSQATQQLERVKRQLFARLSERHQALDPGQGNLLAELAPEPPVGEPPTEVCHLYEAHAQGLRRRSARQRPALRSRGAAADHRDPNPGTAQSRDQRLRGPVPGEKITRRLSGAAGKGLSSAIAASGGLESVLSGHRPVSSCDRSGLCGGPTREWGPTRELLTLDRIPHVGLSFRCR